METSSAIQDVQYPELSEALCKAKSVSEARSLYIKILRKTGDIVHSQYAAKLEQNQKMLSTSNLKQLEQDFFEYKEHMRIWASKSGVQLTLMRRQKSFLGVNSKIRLYIASGKNLSKINDTLGFRIILKTEYPDNESSIGRCYEVLNETIRFFALERDCFLIEGEPRSGETLSAKEAKEQKIFVPKKGFIMHGFENNVKDYVLNPKANGYQSLHVLIENPCGSIFEVQIRTSAMDIVAEYGSGEHSLYKASKYQESNLGKINFSKINMPGFMVLPDGEIYDTIGLQRSIDPFNILH